MSSLCICQCPTLIGRIGGGGGGGGAHLLWCSCSFKRVRNLINALAGYHLTVKYRNPAGGEITSEPAWPETDPACHTVWVLY